MAGCETRTGGSGEWTPDGTETVRSGAYGTGPDRAERAAVMELQVIRLLLLLLSLTRRYSAIETGKTGPEPGEKSDRRGRKTIIMIEKKKSLKANKKRKTNVKNSQIMEYIFNEDNIKQLGHFIGLKSAFIKYINKPALKLH